MPLPGWHPLERGVCLGWKYAGAGWFGHQSAWPGASSYLRVQPERGLALAVVASAQAAALVALSVFGARLAELFESQARAPGEGSASDVSGAYEQAARVVAIAATPRRVARGGVGTRRARRAARRAGSSGARTGSRGAVRPARQGALAVRRAGAGR